MSDMFYAFLIAFTFLTAIPVKLKENNITEKRIKLSFYFYPVIGLFYGVLNYSIIKIFHFVNPFLLSVIILSLPLVFSKALHFDGLLDFFDAFLPYNRTKEQRLAILKDYSIGAYAFTFGVLFVLFKLALINILLKENINFFFILLPVLSRSSIVAISYKSKYPRKQGSASFIVGKIGTKAILVIVIETISLAFGTIYLLKNKNECYITTLILILTTIAITMLIKRYSYKKIDGITGDIIGANVEICEVVLLFVSTLLKGYLC